MKFIAEFTKNFSTKLTVNLFIRFVFICFFIPNVSSAVAEAIVKSITVDINGVSSFDAATGTSDSYTNVYGGMAGAACTDGGANRSTCNSCTSTSGVIQACNQKSIYPALIVKFIFKVTKAVTSAVSLLEIDSGGGVFVSLVSGSSITSTGDGLETFSIETTWGAICNQIGANSTCSPASVVKVLRNLAISVDSDGNGIDAVERKTIPFNIHIIPPGFTPVEQSYCATAAAITAANIGVCNLAFKPGDEKVYIDSQLTGGPDTTNSLLKWDAIAIFPIKVLDTPAAEAAAYTGFNNGLVSPIFVNLSSDGSIPISKIEGALANNQHYCLVYGSKNQAQNIYSFTTTNVVGGCVTPAEVVGVLDDKHCFISTAAFGSELAPEVETFRQFRNQFMLKNNLGKAFVKMYYKYSPPFAKIISGNPALMSLTRMLLYPFLGFSYLALSYGFAVAVLAFFALLILLNSVSKKLFKEKKIIVAVLVLLISFNLKAEISPKIKTAQNPGAAEGLIKIKKDGSYVYKTKISLKKESSRLYFGQASNPEIETDVENPNTKSVKRYNFKDFYSNSTSFLVGYNYEWFPWAEKVMLGLQAGGSIMYANGHGIINSTEGGQAEERFSFFTIPVNLGAIYRFQWKTTQLLVPYVSGGATILGLIEKREDKSSPNFAGGFGFYGAGGMLINLTSFDSETAFDLNSEYGIGNMWLSLEFKVVEVEADLIKLSNQFLNLGITFDF
ncbi:MAG: CFI-box-CTERM domain-containing protein [Pseudobdellovibrio sp.]